MKKFKGLGVGKMGGRVLLFGFSPPKNVFQIAVSQNGADFGEFKRWGEIITPNGSQEEIKKCQDFSLAKIPDGYFLTYTFNGQLCGALWSGFSHWQKTGEIASIKSKGVLVSQYYYKNNYLVFFGGEKIGLASSPDLDHWRVYLRPILSAQKGEQIKLGAAFLEKEGIWLIYYLFSKGKPFKVEAICLSRQNPWQILKSLPSPLLVKKDKTLFPLGAVKLKESFFFYWQNQEGKILVESLASSSLFSPIFLKKFPANPLLAPRPEKPWEAKAVFNSAVVRFQGKSHFLYRAVSQDDVSYWGWAASKDGKEIEERSNQPVFDFFCFERGKHQKKFSPSVSYLSGGGGQGGGEDPRAVRLSDRLYVTFTAFDGFSLPRVALTSIKVKDFLAKHWQWENPVFLSPPGEMHKNWVLFPEKIKGKYALLHSISPQMMIDYFDNLNFDGQTFIKSYYHGRSPTASWEKVVKGVGPPPLKTPLGWLVLYHGLDNDFCQYKMGAMILDSARPEKVLFRAKNPILEPTEVYENQGLKPRIVYSCGAVIQNEKLLVYYGGADTVLCLAWAPLGEFLGKLKSGGEAKLIKTQKRVSLPYG